MRPAFATLPLVLLAACGEGVPDYTIGRIAVVNGIEARFEPPLERELIAADNEGVCRIEREELECIDTGGDDIPCLRRIVRNYSVGPITIAGLNMIEPVLEVPPERRKSYHYGGTVYHPMSRPEWTIVASAPGDELRGFELTAPGVLDLLPLNDFLPLPAGQEITVTWDPAVPADPTLTVELVLGLSSSEDGFPAYYQLTCASADTGSLTISEGISGALIPYLSQSGHSGILHRFRATTLSEPDRELTLTVGTQVSVEFGTW